MTDHTQSQAPILSAELAELRGQIKDMQDAAYTYGEYSQEAVRVALDGVLDAIDALAAAPAVPAQEQAASCPDVVRADLEAIDRAMQHMGDALNSMDACDEPDENIAAPGFEAIARLLAAAPIPPAAPQPRELTDAEIERAFKARGGSWNGDQWVIEDADLHPMARWFLAAPAQKEGAAPVDGKWISVDERMPKCEHECTGSGTDISQTVLIANGPLEFGMGHLQDDGKWVCYGGDHDFMYVDPVTHWLPLPRAPSNWKHAPAAPHQESAA